MESKVKNSMIGLTMMGIGAGLAAAGVYLVVPVCVAWSRDRLRGVYEKGRDGMISGIGSAAETLGEVANKAQHPLSEAAKAAKQTTAIAAGAIESAAHYVRERVQ